MQREREISGRKDSFIKISKDHFISQTRTPGQKAAIFTTHDFSVHKEAIDSQDVVILCAAVVENKLYCGCTMQKLLQYDFETFELEQSIELQNNVTAMCVYDRNTIFCGMDYGKVDIIGIPKMTVIQSLDFNFLSRVFIMEKTDKRIDGKEHIATAS